MVRGAQEAGQAGNCLARGAAAVCVRAMSLLESWLHPLRAYPREFVLACVAISLAGVLWVVSKVAKWSVYALALVVFALTTGMMALWLWT